MSLGAQREQVNGKLGLERREAGLRVERRRARQEGQMWLDRLKKTRRAPIGATETGRAWSVGPAGLNRYFSADPGRRAARLPRATF